jgi:predicted TIM-barrel fold metal-dependent hydrolase
MRNQKNFSLAALAALSIIVSALTFPAGCMHGNQDANQATTANMPDSTLSPGELRNMLKIDAHAHIMEFGQDGEELFTAMLDSHNMKLLDICTFLMGEGSEAGYAKQVELAERFHGKYPDRVSWTTGLSLDGWNSPGWLPKSLEAVRDGFDRGAVALKVWKDIGMTLKDPDSSFVMIDDERFDPVFDFVEKQGKTLVAHIGEPLNCWLPLDSMSVDGDRSYYKEFPQYHCYTLPEIPGYWKQVEARDRVLEKHPGLRLVGCHLGSLESDVDQLAERLEKYPNFAADMAARIVHFQVQDREKVRNFIIKYQDRLLYGTDNLVGWTKASIQEQTEKFDKVYTLDYKYFATDEIIVAPIVREGYECRGLALPPGVLRKIYYENAVRWYPGI